MFELLRFLAAWLVLLVVMVTVAEAVVKRAAQHRFGRQQ